MLRYYLSPENSLVSESLPLQALIPNFPWDEYKEGKGFTLLHEIVCSISGRDLDNAIQGHPADVNRLDHEGRSPLEMAIRHENMAAIGTLLRRGADPNICDGKIISAAMSTSLTNRLMITELLLRSGATIYDYVMEEFLIEWCYFRTLSISPNPESLAMDRLLIEHGMNINYQARCFGGRTILMHLCLEGSITNPSLDHIKHLIGHRADLELKDYTGHTALHLAIISGKSEALKAVVHAGACLDVKTNRGNTIIHLMVIFDRSGNIAKAMSEIYIGRPDLDTKNEDGLTAYDLLRKRNGLRWQKYCEKLLESTYGGPSYSIFLRLLHSVRVDDEYQVILALEAFLHRIQDSQGIPKDQQYPPLGEYLSDDKDENPVPGAWPL